MAICELDGETENIPSMLSLGNRSFRHMRVISNATINWELRTNHSFVAGRGDAFGYCLTPRNFLRWRTLYSPLTSPICLGSAPSTSGTWNICQNHLQGCVNNGLLGFHPHPHPIPFPYPIPHSTPLLLGRQPTPCPPPSTDRAWSLLG